MTPYITPAQLVAAPTGIAWSTIPAPGASVGAQQAEQTNICWRATHVLDGWCNQPLRATLDTEMLSGPDFRVTVDKAGRCRVVVARWPVLQVMSVQVSPASAFPPSWVTLPAGAYRAEPQNSAVGDGASGGGAGVGPCAILLAPGYVSPWLGRNGFLLQVQYVNGWPHAGLTAPAVVGATTLQVDDVTGWSGRPGTVYDGAATEPVQVTAAQAAGGSLTGPGTLTLAAPLRFAHPAGVTVSALPAAVQQAALWVAVAEALTRGATATTIQSLPGQVSSGGGPLDTVTLLRMARQLVQPYARVV